MCGEKTQGLGPPAGHFRPRGVVESVLSTEHSRSSCLTLPRVVKETTLHQKYLFLFKGGMHLPSTDIIFSFAALHNHSSKAIWAKIWLENKGAEFLRSHAKKTSMAGQCWFPALLLDGYHFPFPFPSAFPGIFLQHQSLKARQVHFRQQSQHPMPCFTPKIKYIQVFSYKSPAWNSSRYYNRFYFQSLPCLSSGTPRQTHHQGGRMQVHKH